MGQGAFKKRVVQLVTPKAVSAAMAAWIMACRICFQVIFFELFIGIFVLKDLFFLSFRTKTRNLWA